MASRLHHGDHADMRVSFKGRNPLAFLFARSRREEYLAQYVLREHSRGRSFAEVLDDAYVRNRYTREEQARLLERPELVAAIGQETLTELRLALRS
jgi:hypothetical protein